MILAERIFSLFWCFYPILCENLHHFCGKVEFPGVGSSVTGYCVTFGVCVCVSAPLPEAGTNTKSRFWIVICPPHDCMSARSQASVPLPSPDIIHAESGTTRELGPHIQPENTSLQGKKATVK